MPTTITAQQKQAIRTAVLKHLGVEGEGIAEDVEAQQQVAEATFDETTSRDDQYQAEVASDMEVLLDEADEKQRAEAESARALDFSATDVVRPGAVVVLGDERYVVGVVTDEVQVDGQGWAGLSTDAPLYEAVEGLRAGDTFTFRDQERTVDAVG